MKFQLRGPHNINHVKLFRAHKLSHLYERQDSNESFVLFPEVNSGKLCRGVSESKKRENV